MDNLVCNRSNRWGGDLEGCWYVSENQNKGSVIGWLWAQLACSNYTHGAQYDWQTGKYQCSGRQMSHMWRR